MIEQNLWLEQEINNIKRAQKMDIRNKASNGILIKVIIACVVMLICGKIHGEEIICPHCENSIELEIACEVKPGYWKCPKKGCGYYNLNQIRYCALCGSERQ
jgi:hypothetical protein